jgi:hypothetical protein
MRASGGNMIAEEAEQLLSKVIDALEEMKEHRRVILENQQSRGRCGFGQTGSPKPRPHPAGLFFRAVLAALALV